MLQSMMAIARTSVQWRELKDVRGAFRGGDCHQLAVIRHRNVRNDRWSVAPREREEVLKEHRALGVASVICIHDEGVLAADQGSMDEDGMALRTSSDELQA
mmetsp:Transcript_45842/g.98886  ORF Transcript_45842/g.98886 Transcript_45842/m.98886 type:complete len:101 (-) Transcript_45842:1219-1521(-)